MSEPITLFWQPGCTSCLRVKEFLRSHDVAFNSINIADDPSGLEQLSKYGIKTVPILTQGDRFIFAQVLGEVACFLGLEEDSVQPLPIHELVLKLRMVLAAAQRYVHQIPVSHLDHVLPGRIRTYRELGYHIFRIAECFLEAAAGTTLTDEDLNAPPCEDLQTGADIAEYGQGVLGAVEAWWRNTRDDKKGESIATYFGKQTLQIVLERTTWHSAQHARQLMMVLNKLGIEPDGPLLPDDLAGLPLPNQVWDD